MEDLCSYDYNNDNYCRSEKKQEEKNSHHYYKLHLYLKIMMVVITKMNTSMCNHMYNIINIMSIMKWNNQGA